MCYNFELQPETQRTQKDLCTSDMGYSTISCLQFLPVVSFLVRHTRERESNKVSTRRKKRNKAQFRRKITVHMLCLSRQVYHQKMPLSHFDEKAGVVQCETDWGRWHQTASEVTVEVDLEEGTRGKEVQVDMKPRLEE